jgi:glycosyltransferase involved in cell wall biosynthesis
MGNPLRVAQVVTRFVAGAGGVAFRGALALDPDSYEVTILAADGGSLLTDAERAGLEVVRLRHMVPEFDVRADARALRELTGVFSDGRFDVVHTHSAKAGAIGRVAARLVRTPAVVHTFHGFPFHEFQSQLRRGAYIALERRLARFTDRFLAVGSAVASEAIRRGIAPADRIRVIDSAVAGDIRPVSRAARFEARRLLRVPPGMRVVGSVGRLDYQKAPGDLVAAIAALDRPDVFTVWVGDGPLRQEVARDVAQRGLTDRFVLVGEHKNVPALLPAFDVFAMSSLYEGLPCAVVEAMRCGVPVVATAVNAVPEVVIPGRTGLLVGPRDLRGLARAIDSLLRNPREATRLAAAAREHIDGRFTPEALGADLAETYDDMEHDLAARVSPVRRRGIGVVPAAVRSLT